jgi:outer membrane protein insertion porin family
LYTTVAGLGGDNYFVRSVIDSTSYFPGFWKTTFSIRGRLGYATGYNGEELPLYERFYVGGINTLRGLGFGEGGPRNENDEIIGGDMEAILNIEFIFPISLEAGLKGVIFYDYGGAFDTDNDISDYDLRSTAGFGARWMSPLGPIRLEWGFNLDPKEDEKSNRVEFSMGGLF